MHLFVMWSFVAVLAPIFVLGGAKAALGLLAAPTSPLRTASPPAQGEGFGASR